MAVLDLSWVTRDLQSSLRHVGSSSPIRSWIWGPLHWGSSVLASKSPGKFPRCSLQRALPDLEKCRYPHFKVFISGFISLVRARSYSSFLGKQTQRSSMIYAMTHSQEWPESSYVTSAPPHSLLSEVSLMDLLLSWPLCHCLCLLPWLLTVPELNEFTAHVKWRHFSPLSPWQFHGLSPISSPSREMTWVLASSCEVSRSNAMADSLD